MITLERLQTWLRKASPELGRLGQLPQPALTLRAVLHDYWCETFGHPPGPAARRRAEAFLPEAERLAGLLLSLWLLQAPELAPRVSESLLLEGLARLPSLLAAMPAGHLFATSAGGEELIRFWLGVFGLLLADESPELAQERWQQISSERRQRLFAELRRRRRREQAVQQARLRQQQQW